MDPQTADKILTETLAQWDQVDTTALGLQLVERLHLVKCSKPYVPYTVQVYRLVNRNLTQDEKDKLIYLYTELCPHDGEEEEIIE